jgi:carbamoyltransferase
MKIVGFHCAHDASYSVLENGIPIVHNELERFNRRKNTVEDSIKFFLDNDENVEDIQYMTTHRTGGMVKFNYMDSFNECEEIVKKNGGELFILGHHQSHAANAFFTSNMKEALIVTIDGGGVDNENGELHSKSKIDKVGFGSITTCTTFWYGKDNKIEPIKMIEKGKINLGLDWALCTSKIFGLGTWRDPRGDQAGTVMGMAALGNPDKYISHFERKLTDGLIENDGNGAVNLVYLNKEANKKEQNRFDISASLQKETETVIKTLLTPYIEKYKPKNLCLSGGVSLNCVFVGKMFDWFPGINIFVDPVPYDAGLSLGSSRYVWHQILDNPRIYDTPQNWSPYLGYEYQYDTIQEQLDIHKDKIKYEEVDDDYVVDLLIRDDNVISVYGGGSESGRRALGNRSILADPRSPNMKDIINEKVKHRQWFRPFAPSVLRDYVKNWFIHDVDSPYMNVAMKFKKGMSKKVPAVVHFDDTARLQTVSKEDNEWYYNFIDNFRKKTGVPIILNTSFNDREPIVETPEHALDCFLRTNIDYLYFRDYGILVNKKEKEYL